MKTNLAFVLEPFESFETEALNAGALDELLRLSVAKRSKRSNARSARRRRVLGPDGLAQSNDQLVGLALRSLEASRSWREVRDRLHVLHRTTYDELPILPLWQLVDSYAYRKELTGIGNNIVNLYQNVHQWRLTF